MAGESANFFNAFKDFLALRLTREKNLGYVLFVVKNIQKKVP